MIGPLVIDLRADAPLLLAIERLAAAMSLFAASREVAKTDTPAPAPAPAAHAPAAVRQKVSGKRQVAVLCREYPAGTPPDAIVALLNEQPGPPVTKSQMGVYAPNSLRLSRPASAARPVVASEAKQPPAQPAVIASEAKQPPATRRAEPFTADTETIMQWAADHGLTMRKLDLPAVQERCAAIGHPGFILRPPPHHALHRRA